MPSSTHRADTSVRTLTGIDTVRVLFKVAHPPSRRLDAPLRESWKVDSMPSLSTVALEGNPSDGGLWSPEDLRDRADELRGFVDDHFGLIAERGFSRLDLTTSRPFEPNRGRAFLSGMAALELPRLEGTRRPNVGQARSIWWTGAMSKVIKCRVYCESFKVAGRELGRQVRLEDQRRFPSGTRPTLDLACDLEYERSLFHRRFAPMASSLTGIKATSLPILSTALADEVRYGVRDWREARDLAGAAVLIAGGVRRRDFARDSKQVRSYDRARRQLRANGYVVIDDFIEPVEVELAEELELALSEFGA